MQRILHVVNIMDRGGVETLLMNIFRRLDTEKFQFDFLTHPFANYPVQKYEEEIKSLGGRVYKAPVFSSNPRYYISYMKEFFAGHPEYSIVHGHNLDTAALVYMREAKKAGRYLIAHAHNTQERGNNIRKTVVSACHKMIRKYPDYFFGCSVEAIRFAFGDTVAKSDRCSIFYNGIDLSESHLNEVNHQNEKDRLYGDSTIPVFGTVGRLAVQKNQMFLLDVFAELLTKEPRAILSIVGEGSLEDELRRKVTTLGIESHVRFEGSVSNVPTYLKAFDVFLFPSLYEGLGMAAVEAQAMGLPTLMSTKIPSLANCTDMAQCLSLTAGPEVWADKALEMYTHNKGHRRDRSQQVREAGFDVAEITRKLCSFYVAHGAEK